MAGGPEKCAYLMNELHLAGAIDYKESRSAHGRTVAEQLDALAPDGVDFFMDQVGGDILDTVLERLKPNARVVICGGISQYDGNLNHGKVRENQEFCQFEVHMSLFTLFFCRYKDHRII